MKPYFYFPFKSLNLVPKGKYKIALFVYFNIMMKSILHKTTVGLLRFFNAKCLIKSKKIILLFICASCINAASTLKAQNPVEIKDQHDAPINTPLNISELNNGWICAKAIELPDGGDESAWKKPGFTLKNWMPATVPGTVLTTLLNNHQIPDPYYGMNNKKIPDIYGTGKDFYTYWFVRDFDLEPLKAGEQQWLKFRGVNYGFDVYINGVKLNKEIQRGMFLRRRFNITPYLAKNGRNRLAVLVYPPDVVGNPNGGQGGDGTIARNVTNQYVAGWDWIQPIHDRNTGIWDKVYLQKTGTVQIHEPHVTVQVPGKRWPGDSAQTPAVIRSSIVAENSTGQIVEGWVYFKIGDHNLKEKVHLEAHGHITVNLPEIQLKNPRLWWPNGMGTSGLRPLYDASFSFVEVDGTTSDSTSLKVGIREIKTHWNEHTRSMEVLVNGQRVFIRGGNWITSDAMLRLSKARYDAEIRFHRDMRLNLIRVWGGALTERPEFYEACDKYGLLVMQDFWGSGDCNGRWEDPQKKDDIWSRRQYPDDHGLFLESAADQIKMLRNHPSLAIWCGGNEITLPPDMQHGLQDSLLPLLDTTRWYIDFSNSDSMSFNTLGGNGDGPYGIQQLTSFWAKRTYPFNSEIGSVGIGDATSLKRILPPQNQVIPIENPRGRSKDHAPQLDSVWQYHKYIGYDSTVYRYGQPKNMDEFARMAQLVNYDQYRAMMEGFTSHQWDWYTGFIIWKTQNPWTALRGQMYDYYLDPNACLYGLRTGAESLHLAYNPADSAVYILNNTYETKRNLMMVVKVSDMEGHVTPITQTITQAVPQQPKMLLSIAKVIHKLAASRGLFLSLQLLNLDKEVVSENIYWLADREGQYSGLATIAASQLKINAFLRTAKDDPATHRIEIKLNNPQGAPPAFFNRFSVIDSKTSKRLLPSFYSDNYITLLPGENKTIWVDPPTDLAEQKDGNSMIQQISVSVEGWNLPFKVVALQK